MAMKVATLRLLLFYRTDAQTVWCLNSKHTALLRDTLFFFLFQHFVTSEDNKTLWEKLKEIFWLFTTLDISAGHITAQFVIAKAIHELVGYHSFLFVILRPANLVSVILAFYVDDIRLVLIEVTSGLILFTRDELVIFDVVDIFGIVVSEII